MIFWRKIVIFHTKYPNKYRAYLRSAQFFLRAPSPLTWNPGSAPAYTRSCKTVASETLIKVVLQTVEVNTKEEEEEK